MGPLTRRDRWLTACTWTLVPAFGAMCYWQVTRALAGNSLSWAYVFEWPIFAAYLVHVWWKLLHEDAAPPATAGPAGAPGPDGPGPVEDLEEVDEELAAYNRYLAALEDSGRRKRW